MAKLTHCFASHLPVFSARVGRNFLATVAICNDGKSFGVEIVGKGGGVGFSLNRKQAIALRAALKTALADDGMPCEDQVDARKVVASFMRRRKS